jgi:ferredoxin
VTADAKPGVPAAAPSSLLIIWIGASLALGRGWCSWECFFGGWDDGFSRLRRKAVIRNIPVKWSYLPFAVLIAVALISAAVLEPVYCPWICPFKAVSEYSPVTDVKTAVQAGIFITLFVGLAIVLPILTRRRMQCSLLCPFGAMQSFTNYINPYEVRIDPAQCRKCKLCIRDCPTFSLDEKSLEGGGDQVHLREVREVRGQLPAWRGVLPHQGDAARPQRENLPAALPLLGSPLHGGLRRGNRPERRPAAHQPGNHGEDLMDSIKKIAGYSWGSSRS